MEKRFWFAIGGVNGLVAVIMGAVAAHFIADAHAAELADKASLYQLIHAVALTAIADRAGKCFAAARWLFLAGILFFCGALYFKALACLPVAGLAPIGGIALMAAWVSVALAACKKA